MDMLLLGETMTLKPLQQYNGFWMPARGNNGVGGFEVFAVSGTTLVLGVETKKSDEADPAPGTAIIGFHSLTTATAGDYDFKIVNAKDLVRYALVNSSTTVTVNIHMQFAQPLWLPN